MQETKAEMRQKCTFQNIAEQASALPFPSNLNTLNRCHARSVYPGAVERFVRMVGLLPSLIMPCLDANQSPGELAQGKGNRMILAGTDELHDRIEQLILRNRELETGLQALQESASDQPHPLLRTDVLRPSFLQGSSSEPSTSSSSKSPSTSRISPTHPNPPEDERNPIDSFGTLILGRRGESQHYGRTSRPEVCGDFIVD